MKWHKDTPEAVEQKRDIKRQLARRLKGDFLKRACEVVDDEFLNDGKIVSSMTLNLEVRFAIDDKGHKPEEMTGRTSVSYEHKTSIIPPDPAE